jgi:hypothetical protein
VTIVRFTAILTRKQPVRSRPISVGHPKRNDCPRPPKPAVSHKPRSRRFVGITDNGINLNMTTMFDLEFLLIAQKRPKWFG